MTTRAVLGFYAATAAVALVVTWLQSAEAVSALVRLPTVSAGAAWGSAVAVGLLLLALGSALEWRWQPMRRLTADLQALLGPIEPTQALVWAVASGVGEELLFRGPLLVWLGPWASSVLFGLLHGGMSRRLWAWSVFATLAGLAFAALTLHSGSVWPAALAHAIVNAVNLTRLGRRAAAAASDGAGSHGGGSDDRPRTT